MNWNFIPKKYQAVLDEVYKDSDGWWAYTKTGYFFEAMECHTAHENSQVELMKVIRTIRPCTCESCEEARKNNKGVVKNV